jgi:hypothetical protein
MTIDATLWVPSDVYVNLMPPVPPKLLVPVPVAAFLTHQGGAEETLFAPRPCDVYAWEVRDAEGRVVQAEEPEQCIQISVTRPLEAGHTIRGDNTVPLNGRLLKDGQSYTVHDAFWGSAAAASFIAHIVV